MTISAWSWKLGLTSLVVIGGAIASSRESVLSQITPDTTLGNENSTVTSTGEVDSINGGATRGTNLFHSFGEFSINEGRAAVFTNPSGIDNILTRVTGANPSNILGTLGVAGNANLFLMNPKGIIFGPNARLDIGGSFVGTTANAIAFGDVGFFSATNPETSSSLLTVNPSALLFNQIRAASIENNSVAPSGLDPSSEFTATGLRVPDGNSLLLVGGDINMDGGILNAFGGRVELGGLLGEGTVGLDEYGNNLILSFPNNVERSNISLVNGAGADVTAGNDGSIAVNAQNLEMTGESFLVAGIASGLGSDNSKAGSIDINATIAINLNESFIINQVQREASGQGGDVNISASTLRVEDGAQVSPSTRSAGKGGNLTVNVQNVQLIGSIANPEFPSGLFTSSGSNSLGGAGDLTINTNTLLVKDGAQVNAGTRGAGKGGNLTVDAQNVQLIGTSINPQLPSALFANAEPKSTGDAGDLTIRTNTLLVRDGAVVGTATFGVGKGGNLTVDAQNVQLIGASVDGRTRGLTTSAQPNSTGNAGDLTIRTNTLLVRDGAVVGTATFGVGKGGNLTIDAQDIQIIGETSDTQFASGLNTSTQPNSTGDAGDLTINTNTLLVKDGAQVSAATSGAGKGGSLTVDAQDVQLIGISNDDARTPSDLAASAQPNSTGNAGDLTIKTNALLVQDGATVGVQSLGTGTAGNMTLNVRSIRLNNDALITANTRSATVDPDSEQATINIDSQDLIMRRGSNIRTDAIGNNVIGGDININSNIIAALENSDISAKSANFRGGNVRINASGIFGTQFRDVASDSTSDITATGASPELSGNVELNVPNTDLNSGLINLPTVPVDAEVVQSCTSTSSQTNSEFVVTGRGGLPPTPNEALNPDAIAIDWVTLQPERKNRNNTVSSTSITTPESKPIVEAQGWIINKDGKVVLTASAPTATPHSSWQTLANCSS